MQPTERTRGQTGRAAVVLLVAVVAVCVAVAVSLDDEVPAPDNAMALPDAPAAEPTTPGTYRWVATTAGGRLIEREVTLAPGQTTSVALVFE